MGETPEWAARGQRLRRIGRLMLTGGALTLVGVFIGTYGPRNWTFWLAFVLVVCGLLLIAGAVAFITIAAITGQKRP